MARERANRGKGHEVAQTHGHFQKGVGVLREGAVGNEGWGGGGGGAVEVVGGERPEVVLLPGDICNKREDLGTLASWAREARGSVATFATLGNWEHDAGIDRSTGER